MTGATPLRLAIVAFAAAGLLSHGDSTASASPGPCHPSGSKTVVRNAVARVYRVPTPDAPRSFALEGCAFARGERVSLDDPYSSIYAFLPPALSLEGTVVGVAIDNCPPDDDCSTAVAAIDVGSPAVDKHVSDSSATRKRNELVKVGSLRANGRGAIAWIACPERSHDTQVTPSERPNCRGPGAPDAVYRFAGGSADVRRLDHGQKIDPSSLRRKGSRVSWLHSGKRRSASLDAERLQQGR